MCSSDLLSLLPLKKTCNQIAMAGALGATMLRSMVTADDLTLGLPNLVHRLGGILPLLDEHGVSLALETYEQIPTSALVHLVNGLDSPRIGICLDPANCVSALEHPRAVVELTAAHTINLHVKDRKSTRLNSSHQLISYAVFCLTKKSMPSSA